MNEKELDLIIAALNYCNIIKPAFCEHLKYQGHEDTAKYAKQLTRLRRKLTQELHKVR